MQLEDFFEKVQRVFLSTPEVAESWRHTVDWATPVLAHGLTASCVGRDELCREVFEAAMQHRCVLLFGGRQAGKTSILRRVAAELVARKSIVSDLGRLTVCVSLDLMRMPIDADPKSFFRMMSSYAADACGTQIGGFDAELLPSESANKGNELELLLQDLAHLRSQGGNVDIEFLFLVDEAKRLIGGRFSRHFLGNIFSLLYGDSAVAGKVAMVFTGAQELYALYDDSTSPLGSRAAKVIIPNLSEGAVGVLIRAANPDLRDSERRAQLVYARTGGQAGLSAFLGRQLANSDEGNQHELDLFVEALKSRGSELFGMWLRSLGPEARTLHQALLVNSKVHQGEIAQILARGGHEPYLLDRAIEELRYTGVVEVNGGYVMSANPLYWEFVKRIVA